jgi:hypothetical protein
MSGKTSPYLIKQDDERMDSPDSSEDVKVRLPGNYMLFIINFFL